MTFKPKGSDLEKSISKSRKGYLKVKFLGILNRDGFVIAAVNVSLDGSMKSARLSFII